MHLIGPAAALGASCLWAVAAILAYAPAKLLGPFEFTQTQLISASVVLAMLATVIGDWGSVLRQHWPHYMLSSSISVGANLAMVACLRRGGPRRTQLLGATSPLFTTVVGYLVLGETLTIPQGIGAAVTLLGLGVAILCTEGRASQREPIDGPIVWMVIFGLLASLGQAIGLIAMKPVLLAGTDPLTASAVRTAGGAIIMTTLGLWPAQAFAPLSARTGRLVLNAMMPGVLGYVMAVSLLLYALRSYEAGLVAVLGALSPVVMLPLLWLTSGRRPPSTAWLGAVLVVCGTAIMLLM